MMSKKQWLLVLCLFVIYLLLGAAIFLTIEMAEEENRNAEDKAQRLRIENLLRLHYEGDTQQVRDIFSNLTDYCGKPINYNMSNTDPPPKWDYYHSLFFVITVVSTIGYGNLVPTTATTRIFMILYGLIGIPMNGIVMVTLGEYFGKSFKKLYVRWKNTRIKRSAAKLGLIGQIVLYAVPGLTFFIFLPSTIISVFERWDYDVALYYSFVTLTTIGFGDFVAGDLKDETGFSPMVRYCYQVFLLVWIIGGLGYVVMVIGFITQGMRSRKLVQIEKMLADNIRKTPQRIRNELRSLLHELLFMRVKPVYKGEFEYIPHVIERSQSCPELRLLGLDDHPDESPNSKRKRAMSACYPLPTAFITPTIATKMQSETELEKIDKERTFKPSDAFMQQKDLILKVVDALSSQRFDDGGINCFSDQDILASENIAPRGRRRAASDSLPSTPMPAVDSKPGGGYTWYGADATKASLEFSKQRRARAFSLAAAKLEGPSLLKRLKNRFNIRNKDEKQLVSMDVERQNLENQFIAKPTSLTPDSTKLPAGPTSLPTDPASMLTDRVLEQTSIADFIRALSAIAVPEDATAYLREQQPKRKFGMARVNLLPGLV
ncbi:unnamed protein product [Acanthoscelides obtectus]|uniref:Potassium channel domain-containing protein n=1 Tax=Acanthoscelides obtectus TaxID=200917 RepID=A0A9P0Q9F3_ACAOB|nr:unnamed protein product [Acanthoscelides obtectus]CAK1636371.1 Open rectifier potassium channel protein 1 [Acanthoscelides obtectus]